MKSGKGSKQFVEQIYSYNKIKLSDFLTSSALWKFERITTVF